MKNLLPLLLITLFFGCKQPVKQNIVNEKPQTIKLNICDLSNGNGIIFLDDFYSEYLKVVRTGIRNTDSAYQKIAFTCLGLEGCRELPCNLTRSHYSDTTFFANYINTTKGSKESVKELITSALSDANKLLKNDSVSFYVYGFIKMGGVQKSGGVYVYYREGGMKQVIYIDTTVDTWKKKLKYCIAREFYLDYWAKHHNRNISKTLLLSLTLQGRADFYAHLIYPDINCPWNAAIEKNEEKQLRHRIKPSLQDSTNTWLPFVAHHGTTYYSLSCALSLGYHIVQSALKHHPELTPEQWTNLAPEKILEMSDYK